MGRPSLYPDDLKAKIASYANQHNRAAAAAHFNVPLGSVGRFQVAYRAAHNGINAEHVIRMPDDTPHEATFAEQGEGAFASASTTTIKTLDELIAACKIDTKLWKVDRYETKTYQGYRADKHKDIVWMDGKAEGHVRDEGKIRLVTMYAVKAWLVRREEAPIEMAIDSLTERLKSIRPIAPLRKVYPKGDHLFVPAFFDAHFGRRAHSQDYSLSRASHEFQRAGEALIDRAAATGVMISRILYPFGQDGVDADNKAQTTTRGTWQEMTADQRDVIDAYAEVNINLIERMLLVAPVDAVAIPGNHDEYTTYLIAKIIAAYFRHDPRVKIDNERSPRRYYPYGANLIGMEHGNALKASDLAMKMAVEQPQLWAASKYRTWLRGHFHKAGEVYQAMSDEQGVSIVTFPAFCPPNEWERFMGYVGRHRAAEGRLYHIKHGPAGVFHVFVDDLPELAAKRKRKAA